MKKNRQTSSHASFTADRIRDGDRYELSNGYPIYCAPAGDRHSRHNLTGGSLLDSDPDVQWAGVDAGFTPQPGILRAPDVCVAPPPAEAGEWIPGVPPLAVEYADKGQNEADLKIKIGELLAAGTRYVWVVRLAGPRRVEVHAKDRPKRLLSATDTLEAPGILRNPIPVQALFDRKEAHRVTLRNLLQREGYEDLDAVRRESRVEGKIEGKAEGKIEGKIEGEKEGRLKTQIAILFRILTARGIVPGPETEARIRGCRDPEQLDTWIGKATANEWQGL
ncbi:MAG: Putative restriction endonuclease [Candidatus Kentron sp. G]|nr:MAG: Putative restriction endonuclease [Candidatus Kentron sp. G]